MNAVKYVFLYLCFKLKNKFTAHTIECRQICISVFILQIRELVHQPHYWMATNMYFWSWRSGTLVNVWFSISLQENTECPRFCQVQSTIHNIQPHCWNSQIGSLQFHKIFGKKTFSILWLSLEPSFINHMLAQLCVTRWWSCVLG